MVVYLVAGVPSPEAAHARVLVPITAPTAVLMDAASRQLLYAKTPHLRRSPASTTKIMTALVMINRMDLDTVVTIPSFARQVPPSKAYLRTGEKYRVRDLVRAILISSANDAAEVLGVAAAGSRARFAQWMNQKASAIGCRHTHFVNPSGLPARNQYTTAYDMALIIQEANRYPFLVETLKTRTQVIQSHLGRRIYLRNHNKMLWRDPREVVGKTGWTRSARHCFVGHIKVSNKKVFVSMLGSRKPWHDLKKLADYQFGTSWSRSAWRPSRLSAVETKRFQMALKRAGFNPGVIDGRWGSKTAYALKRFQAAKGLQVDGIPGPKTRHALGF